MQTRKPKELITDLNAEAKDLQSDAKQAFGWFKQFQGEVVEQSEVVERLSEKFEWSTGYTKKVIVELVDDTPDPVQKIQSAENQSFIGIVDYKVFEDEGGYGFIEFDDVIGERRNVVCAKCIEQEEFASEVWRAVAGTTTFKGNSKPIPLDADYEPLVDRLTQHYIEDHTHGPDEVEVGASLVSGTTISSNKSIHGGNQSNFGVDSFGVGNLTDGEVLKNENGSLTGGTGGSNLTKTTSYFYGSLG